MRILDSFRCWRCTLCPCKVRNKFLVSFWNRTILLCIPCISLNLSQWLIYSCQINSSDLYLKMLIFINQILRVISAKLIFDVHYCSVCLATLFLWPPTFHIDFFKQMMALYVIVILHVLWDLGCHINLLNTKRKLFYLKTQFVTSSKHFSSWL